MEATQEGGTAVVEMTREQYIAAESRRLWKEYLHAVESEAAGKCFNNKLLNEAIAMPELQISMQTFWKDVEDLREANAKLNSYITAEMQKKRFDDVAKMKDDATARLRAEIIHRMEHAELGAMIAAADMLLQRGCAFDNEILVRASGALHMDAFKNTNEQNANIKYRLMDLEKANPRIGHMIKARYDRCWELDAPAQQ